MSDSEADYDQNSESSSRGHEEIEQTKESDAEQCTPSLEWCEQVNEELLRLDTDLAKAIQEVCHDIPGGKEGFQICTEAMDELPAKLKNMLAIPTSWPSAMDTEEYTRHATAVSAILRAAMEKKDNNIASADLADTIRTHYPESWPVKVQQYPVPHAMMRAWTANTDYRAQVEKAAQFLSNSVRGAMAITALLRRPGAGPLQEILKPCEEAQLQDVATGRELLLVLQQLQQEADISSMGQDTTKPTQKAPGRATKRPYSKSFPEDGKKLAKTDAAHVRPKFAPNQSAQGQEKRKLPWNRQGHPNLPIGAPPKIIKTVRITRASDLMKDVLPGQAVCFQADVTERSLYHGDTVRFGKGPRGIVMLEFDHMPMVVQLWNASKTSDKSFEWGSKIELTMPNTSRLRPLPWLQLKPVTMLLSEEQHCYFNAKYVWAFDDSSMQNKMPCKVTLLSAETPDAQWPLPPLTSPCALGDPHDGTKIFNMRLAVTDASGDVFQIKELRKTIKGIDESGNECEITVWSGWTAYPWQEGQTYLLLRVESVCSRKMPHKEAPVPTNRSFNLWYYAAVVPCDEELSHLDLEDNATEHRT